MVLFGRKKLAACPVRDLDAVDAAEGLVMFESVGVVFAAERALKRAGYETKAVAPPPELREGCDLSLRINLVEMPGIARVLREAGTEPLATLPLTGGVKEPLDIVKVIRFENETMVRAGNMKLTFGNADGTIVNISGGGCPDIPYLHAQLVGQKVGAVDQPSQAGFTLCALMLQRAYEEAVRIHGSGT